LCSPCPVDSSCAELPPEQPARAKLALIPSAMAARRVGWDTKRLRHTTIHPGRVGGHDLYHRTICPFGLAYVRRVTNQGGSWCRMSNMSQLDVTSGGRSAVEIDEIGYRILEELRDNGRVSIAKLAQHVGISRSNAYAR